MYSMMGPFRGHMSLKSSPFSPGPSCKLSNQYIIQDHMAAHYKKLMSAKAAVDSSAPKSLHTSVKYKDQQKRDRLIQALEIYKKDPVHGFPASPFNPRSVSPSQQKARCSLLENGHPCLTSGRNNSSRRKREQPPSVSPQKLTSRTLLPASTARKNIQNSAQHALSQTPVHSSGTDRSSASRLQQSHMHLGSRNRKKAFQNSFNKTYSGDLLNKHSIYFTEKKQYFTPQILKTSHQSFLVKYRFYNPPPQRKISSPGRPSLKSADVNNEKKRELHRFLEDGHVRPHSDHFSQQPVEVGVPSLLERKRMEPTVHTQKLSWLCGNEMDNGIIGFVYVNERCCQTVYLCREEEYLRFLQDLTNDILIRSCYHKEALEDVFQMHIKSKRHNLDEMSKKRLLLNTLSSPAEMLYINAEQQFMADRLLCNLNTRRGETTSIKAAERVFSMENWYLHGIVIDVKSGHRGQFFHWTPAQSNFQSGSSRRIIKCSFSKKCSVKTPKDLPQVKGRWKTADKRHPAVLPNTSGQEHRTALAAEHHSDMEAERPSYPTK